MTDAVQERAESYANLLAPYASGVYCVSLVRAFAPGVVSRYGGRESYVSCARRPTVVTARIRVHTVHPMFHPVTADGFVAIVRASVRARIYVWW
jgi:hypothetical protein